MKGLGILSMAILAAFIILGSYQLVQITGADWLFIVFFIIGMVAVISVAQFQRDVDRKEMDQKTSEEYERGYLDGSEGKPRR